METRSKTEGWSWIIGSKVDHYFVDGRSLCGRWGILGYGDCEAAAPKPCATCTRALQRREAKRKKA